MALLLVFLATVLNSALAITEITTSQPCGRNYDVDTGFFSDSIFTYQPVDDVMFTQKALWEAPSRSGYDCGRQCVGAEGCVMFTFQRSQQGASGRCQVYGQVYNATQDHEVSPGARSYVVDYEVFRRFKYGYYMNSGRCIRVISENLSYQNATLTCQQLDGGHLLFTKTAQDMTFGHSVVRQYSSQRMWVGADALVNKGDFNWTDGTSLPTGSSLWGSGEPDDETGRQDCVCLWDMDGKLHDCDCDNQFPSLTVCQIDV